MMSKEDLNLLEDSYYKNVFENFHMKYQVNKAKHIADIIQPEYTEFLQKYLQATSEASDAERQYDKVNHLFTRYLRRVSSVNTLDEDTFRKLEMLNYNAWKELIIALEIAAQQAREARPFIALHGKVHKEIQEKAKILSTSQTITDKLTLLYKNAISM